MSAQPPPGAWIPPPPSRAKDQSVMTIVIVVAVVIVVVLAVLVPFVLYVMVSDMIGGDSQYGPIVAFSSVSKGGSGANLTAQWEVAAKSGPASAFGSLKGQILRDGTPLSPTAVTLMPNSIISFGISTVKMIISDSGGGSEITVGDGFQVYGLTGPHTYHFLLIWAVDGHEIASLNWYSESTKPMVIFGGQQPGGSGLNLTNTWQVAGVSDPISPFSSFKCQILMDGVPLTASAQALQPGSIISFGSTTVKLIVRDLGGEVRLTGGDSFLVYGMTSGHLWQFSLLWVDDDSAITTISWNT